MVTPPSSKFTVPVAPVVTVAVSVTDVAKFDDVGRLANVVVDALPDTTGIRGDERRLNSELTFSD